MPEAQLPVDNFGDYTNTTDLKVYFKLNVQGDWEEDTSLVFLGYSPANGTSLGSGSFMPLMQDNDTTRPDYANELRTVKMDAQDLYFTNNQGGSSGPYFLKVTDKINGFEFPVFYGYMNANPNNLLQGRTAGTALSFSGLLSTVDLLGGWSYTTSITNSWKANVDTIFNPGGNGNKGSQTVTVGNITATAINKTKEIETETSDNMYTVLDVINMLLLHLVSNDAVLLDTVGSVQPWIFAKTLYHDDLIEITPEAQALLDETPAVDSYSYDGKSVWGALSELVDSVGNLVLTEKIDYEEGVNAKPILYITKVS